MPAPYTARPVCAMKKRKAAGSQGGFGWYPWSATPPPSFAGHSTRSRCGRTPELSTFRPQL